jgi:hypothetical protein
MVPDVLKNERGVNLEERRHQSVPFQSPFWRLAAGLIYLALFRMAVKTAAFSEAEMHCLRSGRFAPRS